MCPHTATYVSPYCYACVRILLYMLPNTAIYASSYCGPQRAHAPLFSTSCTTNLVPNLLQTQRSARPSFRERREREREKDSEREREEDVLGTVAAVAAATCPPPIAIWEQVGLMLLVY